MIKQNWKVTGVTAGLVMVLASAALYFFRPATLDASEEVPSLALMNARLVLAEEGTFGLIVDLTAGEAELVHGAVTMRRMPVAAPHRSKSEAVLISTLQDRRGTLPYQPIQRVVAPTDTSEATPPDTRPLDADPAYGILTLASGMELVLSPTDLSSTGQLRAALYRSGQHVRRVGQVLQVATGGPYPAGALRLRLADDDARAIFRALPEGAPVIVRF